MRFTYTSAVLFVGKALALAREECLLNNSQDLAAFADCGSRANLAECLAQLKSFEESDVKKCYTSVGCKASEAEIETKWTLNRCEEIGKAGELRKRWASAPEVTGSSPLMVRADVPSAGEDCYTQYTTTLKDCSSSVADGKTTTKCTDATVTRSKCHDDYVCSTDINEQKICMERASIDTAGIVIAIIFAVLIAVGFGSLTFMCCKDKKEQKRLIAKSEAVALARAATKKKNAADRAKLARKYSGQNVAGGAGESNPFQDQNRI